MGTSDNEPQQQQQAETGTRVSASGPGDDLAFEAPTCLPFQEPLSFSTVVLVHKVSSFLLHDGGSLSATHIRLLIPDTPASVSCAKETVVVGTVKETPVLFHSADTPSS